MLSTLRVQICPQPSTILIKKQNMSPREYYPHDKNTPPIEFIHSKKNKYVPERVLSSRQKCTSKGGNHLFGSKNTKN